MLVRYNCVNKKQITAVVTLNTMLYNFNDVNGVQPFQVVVNTVVSSTGNRRLLSSEKPEFIYENIFYVFIYERIYELIYVDTQNMNSCINSYTNRHMAIRVFQARQLGCSRSEQCCRLRHRSETGCCE